MHSNTPYSYVYDQLCTRAHKYCFTDEEKLATPELTTTMALDYQFTKIEITPEMWDIARDSLINGRARFRLALIYTPIKRQAKADESVGEKVERCIKAVKARASAIKAERATAKATETLMANQGRKEGPVITIRQVAV